MDNIAYIGLSRQMTLQRALTIAANNMANVDTTGFKVEQPMLEAQPGAPAKDEQVLGPAQFVLDKGLARDFSQGVLQKTGAPLDLAIQGSGFFQIQTAQGVRYTRDGAFSIDNQNRLVDKQGDPVLDDGGAEIRFDPLLAQPAVGADGVISQGNQRVAQLGVVDFPSTSVLSKQGDNLYANTSNAQPTQATNAQVRQGMLEASNVKPVLEVTNLIQISRAYEQVSQMVQSVNDLTEQSIQRLGKVS